MSNKYTWQRVFAILPVKVNGKLVWLRYYERKWDYKTPYVYHLRLVKET